MRKGDVRYKCPRCGEVTEQPKKIKGITHPCPKATPYLKRVKLKEQK